LPAAAPALRPCRAADADFLLNAVGFRSDGKAGLVSSDDAGNEAETQGRPIRRETYVTYRIVLADDHTVVRQSLKKILNQQEDFNLVGEADNGLETLSLVKQLQPDLLVTDLMMPGMNGLEVARRIRLSFPATRIVVVSVSGDEPYVAGAFRCGANAFVLKTSCGRHLVPAVRAVLMGHRYVSPPLSEPVL
jgi:DNA-binding NarL/FixJ family response regulator